jgi:hypothetical protein
MSNDREEEFYELMQAYRTSPINRQSDVIKSYEAVKAFIAADKVALVRRVRELEGALDDACNRLDETGQSPLIAVAHWRALLTKDTP